MSNLPILNHVVILKNGTVIMYGAVTSEPILMDEKTYNQIKSHTWRVVKVAKCSTIEVRAKIDTKTVTLHNYLFGNIGSRYVILHKDLNPLNFKSNNLFKVTRSLLIFYKRYKRGTYKKYYDESEISYNLNLLKLKKIIK